jgi:hypothetical protein
MISDRVLMEFVRNSPLQKILLETAWPSLSVESKLGIIEGMAQQEGSSFNTPDYLVDLALSDSAQIVRYWGVRHYSFRRPNIGPDGKEKVLFGRPTPAEEIQRTARADADPSPVVRAASMEMPGLGGLGLGNLIALPQLARLVKIRRLDRPDTDGFATFVETAVAKGGASLDEVRDCMWEYFRREDVRKESRELDEDAWSEVSKQRGWESLWKLAATAPDEVGRLIANYAAIEGKYWEIKLEQLEALPDRIKRTVMHRDEKPAEKLRETVLKSPEKHPKELVDAANKYYKWRSEDRFPTDDDKQKYQLEHMPRQEAVFQTVKELREEVERLKEAFAATPKLLDLTDATRRILNWVVGIGIGVAVVLYLMATSRH